MISFRLQIDLPQAARFAGLDSMHSHSGGTIYCASINHSIEWG